MSVIDSELNHELNHDVLDKIINIEGTTYEKKQISPYKSGENQTMREDSDNKIKTFKDSEKNKTDNNMFKELGNHKNILEEYRKSLISRESKGRDRDRGSLFNLNESLKKHDIENESEINNMSLMD